MCLLAAFSALSLSVGLALLAFTHVAAKRAETRFKPSGTFVEAQGARLHVAHRAPEGAIRASILLVHGASGNQADMMAPLGERLAARGFQVFAVDRPGLGYSERLPIDAASPGAQAGALRKALEKLGVGQVIVVGHSWAGAVALNFLLDHADFAEGAVLLAPVTHPWPFGVRWYYRLAAAPVLGWLFVHLLVTPLGLAGLSQAIASVFQPQPTPPGYSETTGAALALRPKAFRANAQDVVGLRAFLSAQALRLGAIAKPVAILAGDHDGVVLTERHCSACLRDLADVDLTILPGVGHSPHWAAPEATAALIESFACEKLGLEKLGLEKRGLAKVVQPNA